MEANVRRGPATAAFLDDGLDWLDAPDDTRIRTHWTRILAFDLEANDVRFAGGRRVLRGAAVIAKAMLGLIATYALVCLLVAALVYASRAPDPTSLLLPRPDAQAPVPPRDLPPPTHYAISRMA